MKKEELEALGLTAEAIAKIFELNGKDINNARESVQKEMKQQVDDLQTQLNTATETLKGFDGVNPEQLKGEISNLNQKLAEQKKDFEDKILERDFNELLNAKITSFGGRDIKAIVPFLDIETLKVSKNQEQDLTTALETVKKEKDFLFNSDEPFKNPVSKTANEVAGANQFSGQELANARALLGLPPLKNN